jgi:hypothetical protein
MSSGLGDGVDDIERLVAVEGRDLDGDDILDFGELLPKRAREHFSAHGGLEVKTDDRDDFGDLAAVSDHFGLGGRFEGSEAEQRGIVTELAKQCGLANGLWSESAHAADAHEASRIVFELFGGEREHGFKECVLRIADRELCGVHANRDATGSGGVVVAQQGTLTSFVELARGIQRQRAGGNDKAAMECGADVKVVQLLRNWSC